MQSKKKAAKIAHVPVESLPQTVPPELVGIARNILLEKQTERNIQAMDAHITQTRAMSEYQLNLHDLEDLPYLARRNPHYRSAAPMCSYTLRDITRTVYLKHGGPDGLKAAQEKSALRKERLRQTKEVREQERREKRQRERAEEEVRRQQRREQLMAAFAERGLNLSEPDVRGSETCSNYIYNTSGLPLERVVDEKVARRHRKQELVPALAARGLQLRDDSSLCEQYIEKEDECEYSLDEIVDIMHEMHFYFKYSDFDRIKDREYEKWREYGYSDYDHAEINDNAKRAALSSVVKNRGLKNVLALPDLPPTLQRRLEQQQQQRTAAK